MLHLGLAKWNWEEESIDRNAHANEDADTVAIRRLVGRDGRDGRDGTPGVAGRDGLRGEKGERGEAGMTGPAGPPGPSSTGLVYTRWGKTSCPNATGTILVYQGNAGRAGFNQGGGANYQCMPNDPEYSAYRADVQGQSRMFGVEYQRPLTSDLQNANVPCAVCHVTTRGAMMMIPVKLTCPTSWTKEYSRYLMSQHKDDSSATFECVDSDPEAIPESGDDTYGGQRHHEASCNGFSCPPYDPEKELTCVVCTK